MPSDALQCLIVQSCTWSCMTAAEPTPMPPLGQSPVPASGLSAAPPPGLTTRPAPVPAPLPSPALPPPPPPPGPTFMPLLLRCIVGLQKRHKSSELNCSDTLLTSARLLACLCRGLHRCPKRGVSCGLHPIQRGVVLRFSVCELILQLCKWLWKSHASGMHRHSIFCQYVDITAMSDTFYITSTGA